MSSTTQNARQKTFMLSRTTGKVIKGKRGTLELAVVALMTEGHFLMEDVSGVDKTTLAYTMAMTPNIFEESRHRNSSVNPEDYVSLEHKIQQLKNT